MAKAIEVQNEYMPDVVSPPGETLLETLDAIGMSQAQLARRMGRPIKTVNEIIRGKAAITAETAVELEQVLRIPASFWLKREQQYRESLARLQEEQRLASWTDWLKEFPWKELVKRGWMQKGETLPKQVFEALKFFGVASPDAWHAVSEQEAVAFRKSLAREADVGATAAWLRQGELAAQEITCDPYDKARFRNTLRHIRSLTIKPPEVSQPEMVRLCADAGVAVVMIRELPKTGASGATRWLTPQKALIQLSFRYKTDDQFWFTFFHEAAHILLHNKRTIFFEDGQHGDDQEQEANVFAANMLINPLDWQRFIAVGDTNSKDGIRHFAAEQGIAPGIVVGRLQHEKLLPFTHCNDLRQPLTWTEE